MKPQRPAPRPQAHWLQPRWFAALLGWSALSAGAASHSDLPVVTLHFQTRPPYYFQQGSAPPSGLVVAPLRQALALADLPHRFVLTPSQRQLLLIEGGQGLDCGIGWFRNPTREGLGQFSAMLYRDQPIAMLARSDAGLRDGMSMREAVGSSTAQLLVKKGFSYGPELDALIASRRDAPLQTTGDVQDQIRMLIADRAKWLPAAPEEGKYLIDSLGREGQDLRVYRFSDSTAGQTRHLYCNKAVPGLWLQRLDAALQR